MIENSSYTSTINSLEKYVTDLSYQLENYMDSFKEDDFFDFSLSDEKKLYYKQSYFVFFSKASVFFNLSQKINANISELLIYFDRIGDQHYSEKVDKLFSDFKELEELFYNYSLKIEKEFSKKQISISLIFNETKRLKFNTDIFLKENFKAEF